MVFSSNSLPLTERASAYEGALRRYFSSFGTRIDVRVEPPGANAFEARLDEFTIGTLMGAVHRSTCPHFLHARPPTDGEGHMDLYLIQEGQLSLTDDNGTVDLTAGDVALMRANAEFTAKSTRMEMIAVGFPESLMGTRTNLHGWGVTHRLSRDSGLTACLQSLLSTAVSRHRSLSVAEGAVVQTALLDAISVLSTKSSAGDNQGLSLQQREKLAKIKALALRSLQLQSVDPASIARESGISVRSLHRLFNSSGSSFGEWLRERRLERCWNEIREPGRARNTIAAIAFAWGFSDLRTFNRAFAARYGMTPSAARHLAAGRGFQADTAARKSSVSSSVASIASSGK